MHFLVDAEKYEKAYSIYRNWQNFAKLGTANYVN